MTARATRQVIEVLASGSGGKARVTQQQIEALGRSGFEFDIEDTLGLQDFVNSKARVTQQFIEVLADAVEGTARVTQQQIEVLGDFSALDLSVGSSLGISDDAEAGGSRHLSVGSTLALSQSLPDPHFSVRNLEPESDLTLTDVAVRVVPVDVASILNLSDKVRRIFLVDSEMELTDEALNARTKLMQSFLELENELERQIIWNRDVANVAELESAAHVFILSAGILCNYRPQVGSGPRTIPTTMPTLNPTTLNFFWPFDTPSESVELRSPEFGNRYSFNANRVNRKTRRGTKRVYRKSTWPKWITVKMDFTNLSATKVAAFKTFVNDHLGDEIGLEDHEGRMWRGILTTPDFEITQLSGRLAGCENYSLSLEFEGEYVPS